MQIVYDQHRLVTIFSYKTRGGSRIAATSKMEHFVMIVSSFQPLTIITKSSILDVAAALDPPLKTIPQSFLNYFVLQQTWKSVHPDCHFVFLLNWKTKSKLLYLFSFLTLIMKMKIQKLSSFLHLMNIYVGFQILPFTFHFHKKRKTKYNT